MPDLFLGLDVPDFVTVFEKTQCLQKCCDVQNTKCKTQHTKKYKTQNAKHKGQNTKYKTQNTKQKTQNTKHKGQNTKYKHTKLIVSNTNFPSVSRLFCSGIRIQKD